MGRTLIYNVKLDRVLVQTDERVELPEGLSRVESVNYAARDGTRIQAYLYKPNNVDGPLPTIVNPHGGPFSRTTYQYDPFVQLLVSRGYAVLQPNFRGSTGLGRNHVLAGVGSIHNLMIDDIADGVHWLG